VVSHPIRPYIEHVDLLVIRRGEKVGVDVPVLVVGAAAPGTLVNQELNAIQVEADVSSIPEQIEVSVEGLPAGTLIQASQVQLPEGTTLLTDPEILVVNVVPAPTEADLEAEIDTEGAGVVEDAPQSETETGSATEAPAESGSSEG
jgi:large subunit ribosomal protein L25